MKSLTGRITVTEETDVLLRGMVDQVRNPPFAFQLLQAVQNQLFYSWRVSLRMLKSQGK